MKKHLPKIVMGLVILILGTFVLFFPKEETEQKNNQITIVKENSALTKEECDHADWFVIKKEHYCMDANFCPEPCWPEIRKE